MLTVAPVSTLDPVNFTPGASQQQPALPLGTGTIVAGPDRVWDLTRPITLDGVLNGRDPATGQVSIQTALGTLVLSTQATLPPGGAIIAQLTPGNPPTVALLSQPAIGSVAPQITAQQPAVILQGTASPAQSLLPGQFVTLVAVPDSARMPLPIANIASPDPTDTALSAGTASPTEPPPSSSANASVQQAVAAPAPANASISSQAGSAQAAPTTGGRRPHGQASSPQPLTVIPPTVAAPTAGHSAPPPIVARTVASPGIPSAAAAAEHSAVDSVVPPSTAIADPTGPTKSAQVDDRFMGLSSVLAAQIPDAEAVPRSAGQNLAPWISTAPSSPADNADSTMTARILAVLPSDTVIPVAVGGLLGRVAGSTLGAQPILDTADGRFVMQTAVSLPVGTQILFEAVEPLLSHGVPLAPMDGLSGKGWPALDAALAALIAPSDQAAAAAAIPRAGPLLAPLLLMFVAGLRSGDIRNWLSDKTLDALRRAGRADIIGGLEKDFAAAARQSAIALADGWHSIPVPFLHQGELERLQLYLRHRSPDESDSPNPDDHNGVRFMIELEPSAVGPIQLEGLVKRSTAPSTPSVLELILRSRRPLPNDIRAEINRLFTTTLKSSGLTGHLAFHGENSWVAANRDRQPSRRVVA